jgi:hypothetical protein
MSDKFMWDYIKTIQCKDIGVHVIEIFNFIMNNILILCEEDKNPITYFVGVIDESVKWFLRSVYKGSIVYDDSISTEDIQGINVDNLKTYSYNDTLGRLKNLALVKILDEFEQNRIILFKDKKETEPVVEAESRLKQIEFISPIADFLVFPILSNILSVPYKYFQNLSPENCAILSAYLFPILKKVFKSKYEDLFSLLEYYPGEKPSILTTYKIKNTHLYFSKQNMCLNFFGFKTRIFQYPIFSNLVGKISRCRLYHIFTGERLVNLPRTEDDIISFYNLFFANKLENELQQVRHLILSDF